jgi:hypothetical protein
MKKRAVRLLLGFIVTLLMILGSSLPIFAHTTQQASTKTSHAVFMPLLPPEPGQHWTWYHGSCTYDCTIEDGRVSCEPVSCVV